MGRTALHEFRRVWGLAASLVLVSAVGGCAGVAPPAPGTFVGELRQSWGDPTGRYTLADGGTRWEYATGPYGRSTWMIDLDAEQRVRDARQVLSPASFDAFQRLTEPQTRGSVLLHLGRPGERMRLGWLGGEVWSWRFETYDCLWFQVSFDAQGQVTGSGYGPDPVCEVRDRDD